MKWIEDRLSAKSQDRFAELWTDVCDALRDSCESYMQKPEPGVFVACANAGGTHLKIECALPPNFDEQDSSAHPDHISVTRNPNRQMIEVEYTIVSRPTLRFKYSDTADSLVSYRTDKPVQPEGIAELILAPVLFPPKKVLRA